MDRYTQHDGRRGHYNPLSILIPIEEKVEEQPIETIIDIEEQEVQEQPMVKKLKRRRKLKESHLIS